MDRLLCDHPQTMEMKTGRDHGHLHHVQNVKYKYGVMFYEVEAIVNV